MDDSKAGGKVVQTVLPWDGGMAVLKVAWMENVEVVAMVVC